VRAFVRVFVWVSAHRWVPVALAVVLFVLVGLLSSRFEPWIPFFVLFAASVGVARVEDPQARWPVIGAAMLAACALVWIAQLVR
jgi:hypothetical protein